MRDDMTKHNYLL